MNNVGWSDIKRLNFSVGVKNVNIIIILIMECE